MSQMERKKAPYYPAVFYTTKTTRFGALETDYPNLYDNKLPGKTIVKVDALGAIKRLLGENVYRDRTRLYKLLSGSCEIDELRALLISFYKKYSSFANHTDNAVMFGGEEDTTLTKVISPLREMVDNELESVKALLGKSGGKIVMVTHDYVYATFNHSTIPELDNSVIIK